jgi:ABC-type transporter Mla subunit MlaD
MPSDIVVSQKVARLIAQLDAALREQYADFTYTISGNGHLIAAHNRRNGDIEPTTRQQRKVS